MNPSACHPYRDVAIEKRIATLPVNAAHREMAGLHYRHAIATAERAFALIERLKSFAGMIRMGVADRSRRIGTGLK